VNLDSYAEVVARSQTGNASRQAHINRLQEYGLDLVQITVHFPCSPLCEPYQGRVFSISGNDPRYPSLQSAIDGGLYHPNCKHGQANFSGEVFTDRDALTPTQNAEQYEEQLKQRYNERQIKAWKRREVSAIEEKEVQKAKAKVREWQKRQRELLDSSPYLRRNYAREQI
jgi:hypothetical protein